MFEVMKSFGYVRISMELEAIEEFESPNRGERQVLINMEAASSNDHTEPELPRTARL